MLLLLEYVYNISPHIVQFIHIFVKRERVKSQYFQWVHGIRGQYVYNFFGRLSYNYAGLSDDEVSQYILHKIQLAGASSTIIDPAALAAVHSFTQGNPRLIDNLMTDALTIGSQQDKKIIDAEIIRAAVDNQGLY